MTGVMSVLTVNVTRSLGRPWYVIMTVALLLAAILAAVLVGTRLDVKPTIAYVTEPPSGTYLLARGKDAPASAESSTVLHAGAKASLENVFRVETPAQTPAVSQLMRNRYDAIIVDYGNGQGEIVTVKGDAFRRQLEHIVANPDVPLPSTGASRGVGATIVGYLVMFVLISGSAFMNFFTDDKSSGTFRRTATSPVGVPAYLAGQLLFNGLVLFVPAAAVLVALNVLFGVDIGFSYGQYALLLSLLSALATAFGFFMAAVIEDPDDAMAVASAFILVTSLLGGTFFIFQHDGAIMQVIINALPQSSLMRLAQHMEQGDSSWGLVGASVHVAGVAMALTVAGWAVCQRRFRAGRY